MGLMETAATLRAAVALARWLLVAAVLVVLLVSLAGTITGLVLALVKDTRLWSIFALSLVFGLGSLYILKLAHDGLTLVEMLMGLCTSEEHRQQALENWSAERKAQLHAAVPPLAHQVFSAGRTDGATFEQMIRQYLEDFILSKIREMLFYPLVLFAVCAVVFFAQGGAMGSGSATFVVLMVLGSLSAALLVGGLCFGCCVYTFIRARMDALFRTLHESPPAQSSPPHLVAQQQHHAIVVSSPAGTVTSYHGGGGGTGGDDADAATGLPVARPVSYR